MAREARSVYVNGPHALRARVHQWDLLFRLGLLDGVRQSDTQFLQSRSRLHAQAQDRTDRDVKAADGSEDIHALHDCIDIGLSPAPPLKSRSLAP